MNPLLRVWLNWACYAGGTITLAIAPLFADASEQSRWPSRFMVVAVLCTAVGQVFTTTRAFLDGSNERLGVGK